MTVNAQNIKGAVVKKISSKEGPLCFAVLRSFDAERHALWSGMNPDITFVKSKDEDCVLFDKEGTAADKKE